MQKKGPTKKENYLLGVDSTHITLGRNLVNLNI